MKSQINFLRLTFDGPWKTPFSLFSPYGRYQGFASALLCSVMYAPCCQTLICSDYAKSVETEKHYMPSTVGTSFSMKNETLHLIAGFNNILIKQSVPSHIYCMEKRELSAKLQEGAGNCRHTDFDSSWPHLPSSCS